MTARDLLIDLQTAGIEVRLENDQIRLVAGRGAIPAELRLRVQRLERDLLALLRTESWLVQAPLSVFAQCQVELEVYIPGLPETLWFVSDAGQVDRLRTRGIRRGRIWTASELRDLMAAPGMSHEDAVAIARAKLEFNGTVDSVRPDQPPGSSNASAAPPEPEPTQGLLDLDTPAQPEFD